MKLEKYEKMDNIKDYVMAMVEDLEAMSEKEIIEEINNAHDIEITCSIEGDYRGTRITIALGTITLGGPNIYINTNSGMIEGCWYSDEFQQNLSDKLTAIIDDYIEALYKRNIH